MTWRTAFSRLAAVNVTGVQTSYDLDDLPNTLPAADLPALAPSFPDGGGQAGGLEGLETLTYDGSAWLAALEVDHVLYWSPAWSEVGLSAVLPDLVEAVDSYLDAVSADGTLGGVLDEELTILRVQVGVVEYGGVKFFGARFRHRWVRMVG
jgi:hypothetical protein